MPLDSPHDAFFKEIFSKPEYAAVELRAVLPPALAERFDFTTLRLETGAFVEVGERDRHAGKSRGKGGVGDPERG